MIMYVRRCSLLVVAFLFAGVFFSSLVSAHAFETDGNMTVILHVEPDDSPRAGQKQQLVFFYKDATQQFTSKNCNCRVTITRPDGSTSYSGLAQASGAQSNELSYTFQSSAVYGLTLSGTPRSAGSFQPFVIRYDVHVTPDPLRHGADTNSILSTVISLLTVTASLTVIVLLGYYALKRSSTSRR